MPKGLGRGNLKLRADGRGGEEESWDVIRALSVLYSQDRFVGKKFGRLLYNRSWKILVVSVHNTCIRLLYWCI